MRREQLLRRAADLLAGTAGLDDPARLRHDSRLAEPVLVGLVTLKMVQRPGRVVHVADRAVAETGQMAHRFERTRVRVVIDEPDLALERRRSAVDQDHLEFGIDERG